MQRGRYITVIQTAMLLNDFSVQVFDSYAKAHTSGSGNDPKYILQHDDEHAVSHEELFSETRRMRSGKMLWSSQSPDLTVTESVANFIKSQGQSESTEETCRTYGVPFKSR